METENEMCDCGHFGGRSNAKRQHENRIEIGHGACKECHCPQFTWIGFCDEQGKLNTQPFFIIMPIAICLICRMKFQTKPCMDPVCFPCNDKQKILDQFSNYEAQRLYEMWS